jgi:hypothetical protein
MIYPIQKRDVRGAIQNIEHTISLFASASSKDDPWMVSLENTKEELIKLLELAKG